jgi:ATP-dependent HslUV protease subunit HslV
VAGTHPLTELLTSTFTPPAGSGRPSVRATTIVAVRHRGSVAMAGDGQVTTGDMVLKHGARKIHRLYRGRVLAGFAGSVADALTLFDRFEGYLDRYGGALSRAAVELTKEWRSDRYLRRLEAALVVADAEHILLLSGEGHVIEPDEPVLAIGSGGGYALAAARALLAHSDLSAPQIARRALEIAAELCIYTNTHITVEVLDAPEPGTHGDAGG